MPTDRVHRLPQQAQPRAIPPHRPLPSASDAATRPRHAHPGSEREALHQLASVTSPPSWCNTTKQHAQSRALPPNTPQPAASDAATRPRHAHPGSEREALHQLASVTSPPSWCNTTKQHAQSRALPPNTPQPAASDAATRPRNTRTDSAQEPLHPLRRDTPDPSRCTRSEGV